MEANHIEQSVKLDRARVENVVAGSQSLSNDDGELKLKRKVAEADMDEQTRKKSTCSKKLKHEGIEKLLLEAAYIDLTGDD